ncbi:uncharacterized protein EV420DRAFT_1570102 [Desarmillaria tabescens]|uniref:F-box domain-containing protein n=1 Tax=Armillaria tabescens TaxID=1929756 RepID=A0AA39JRC7_ARMTA|nr:uncharacterized protein EV420DRAFT_1570102 [Desarmillaria tabescens]KAK0446565.1 hypothetical protein EV420DRAFT_1570102 [Desarmillaria tabescens]
MITSILRKRRPLLDVDVSWIEKDIAAYEQELSNLKTQVALLKHQKEQLERSLSRHKSLLSPIHRLPCDILVEIFRWAAHRPKSSLDVTKGVWPLGQVCGWWRDIVLASPILWSVVILEPPYTRHSVDILTHHFCHSAELPLWIAVTAGDSVNDRRVFDMVIQKSALWKMVDICTPLKDLEKLSSVSGNIPFLEELYVYAEGKVYFSTDALSSAPSLRRAGLQPLEIQTLIDVRILFFDDADGPLDFDNPLPVKMERLQFLAVYDARILDHLIAPLLRKFEYHPASALNGSDTDIPSLRDFLARSSCSIELLVICPETVHKIHHLMAFIKNVSRTVSSLDPLTLPEVLPAMEGLRLWICTDSGWGRQCVKSVIAVVRQRFDKERATVLNVTKLSYLRIDCADSSRVFSQLKSEGLDVLGGEGLDWEKGTPYLEIDEYWTGDWFS